MMNIYHKILAEGNGGAVKLCQKEAGVQSHELTNRNSIRDQDGRSAEWRQEVAFIRPRAKFGGESAQQDEAQTSLNMVNAR